MSTKYSHFDAMEDSKLLHDIEDLTIFSSSASSTFSSNNQQVWHSLDNFLSTARFFNFAEIMLNPSIVEESVASSMSKKVVANDGIILRVSEIKGISSALFASSSSSTNDTSERQVEKDMGRDRLLLNGVYLLGAEVSFAKTKTLLGDQIDACLVECNLPLLPEAVRTAVVMGVLRMASRTHAGGVAYHAVDQFVFNKINNDISSTGKKIIVPSSHLASPVKLRVFCGSLGSSSLCIIDTATTSAPRPYASAGASLCVHICVTNIFSLKDEDGDGDSGELVEAVFEVVVAVGVGVGGVSADGKVTGLDRDSGIVRVRTLS